MRRERILLRHHWNETNISGGPIVPTSRPQREQWKAAGLCPWCGKQPEPGRKFCRPCLDQQAERYRRHRAAGLCYCGRARAEGRTRCEACLGNNGAAGRARRTGKIAVGLCACGRELRPGKRTCSHCATRGRRREQARRDVGLCRCGKHPATPGMATCEPCREYKAERSRQVRAAAIEGYGGRCVCCGEDDPNTLELDHVNGDGGQHRREVGGAGDGTYKWAIANGFPDRLQLLCGSCHRVKTRTGDCSYRRGLNLRG